MNSHELPSVTSVGPLNMPFPNDRPPQVVIALTLAIAGLVFSAIAMAFSWNYVTLEESTTQIVLTLTLSLVLVAWMLYKIYLGRNWARILYLVLAIPIPLISSNEATTEMSIEALLLVKVSSVFNGAIAIAVLWLLFTRPGSTWFKSQSRAPAA